MHSAIHKLGDPEFLDAQELSPSQQHQRQNPTLQQLHCPKHRARAGTCSSRAAAKPLVLWSHSPKHTTFNHETCLGSCWKGETSCLHTLSPEWPILCGLQGASKISSKPKYYLSHLKRNRFSASQSSGSHAARRWSRYWHPPTICCSDTVTTAGKAEQHLKQLLEPHSPILQTKLKLYHCMEGTIQEGYDSNQLLFQITKGR